MNNKTMTSQELKEAIRKDIEGLNTLDVDIMPADEYYSANARLSLYLFLKLYGTILLGVVLPFLWYGHHVSSLSGLLHYLSNLIGMFVVASGFCAFAFLFVLAWVNQYVLFNYQLRHKLKTGELIVQKTRWIGRIAYRIFAAIVLIPSFFFPPGFALTLSLVGFFVSWFVTNFIFQMEINRLGISTLITLVNTYFDKDKRSSGEVILKK